MPEQTRLRMAVRQELLDAGVDPYPPTFRPSRTCNELRLGAQVSVAGRVLAVRDLGVAGVRAEESADLLTSFFAGRR